MHNTGLSDFFLILDIFSSPTTDAVLFNKYVYDIRSIIMGSGAEQRKIPMVGQ